MDNELKIYIYRIASELDCSASNLAYNPMERFAEYVSEKEVVHSKIIADLLNPNGKHQLGNGFLIKFLQSIGVDVQSSHFPEEDNPFNLPVKIETEKYAPTKLDGVETKGRIDISILVELSNNKKFAVIIENKLNDAPDQPRQLERYNAYVENELGYNADERITVYMPRTKCEYDGTIVIDATQLAGIIEMALNESISPNKATIQAYVNYLRNISMKNIIMDNAVKLSNMTSKIKYAKVIKEAYDLLPQAFAARLRERNDGNNGYKAKISGDYSHYCYIWKEDSYKNTGLWLAIGFYYDNYRIYVVSDNEFLLQKNKYDSILNLNKAETSKGKIWLIPQNTNDFEIKFDDAPDFDSLQYTIDAWLLKLDQVASFK